MTRYHTAFAFAAAASLAGCASLYDTAPRTVASSTIANAAGMPIGTAQFVDTAGRLHVNVSVTGLPAGTHAVHLHQVGRCQAPDFTSAGGTSIRPAIRTAPCRPPVRIWAICRISRLAPRAPDR